MCKRRVNFFFHSANKTEDSVLYAETVFAVHGIKARGYTDEGATNSPLSWEMEEKVKHTASLISACDVVVMGDGILHDDASVQQVIAEAKKYEVPVFWLDKKAAPTQAVDFTACIDQCRSLLGQ